MGSCPNLLGSLQLWSLSTNSTTHKSEPHAESISPYAFDKEHSTMSFLDDLPPLNRCGICVQVSSIIGIVFTGFVVLPWVSQASRILLYLGMISDGDNAGSHIQAPSVTIIFTTIVSIFLSTLMKPADFNFVAFSTRHLSFVECYQHRH